MPTAKEQLRAIFKDTADAIRTKDGTTEEEDKIFPTDYPDRILAIESGVDTSDATAEPSDIIAGKTAYTADGKVEGSMSEIDPNSDVLMNLSLHEASGGVRATVIQYGSGHSEAWDKELNLSLDTQGPTLITPSTSKQIAVPAYKWTTGAVEVDAIPTAGSISGTLGVTAGANWSSNDPNRGSGTVSITGVNQTAGYTNGYSNGSFSVAVPANRLLKGRTITPGKSQQLVGNAEDILYGAINVAGDSNLISSNIKSGVSIFGVSGSYSGGGVNIARGAISISGNDTDFIRLSYSLSGVSLSSKHVFTYVTFNLSGGHTYYTLIFGNDYIANNDNGYVYGYFMEGNSAIGISSNTIAAPQWSGSTVYLSGQDSTYIFQRNLTITRSMFIYLS